MTTLEAALKAGLIELRDTSTPATEPQPAANTRVVRKLAAALWFESEGEAVEPLYDVSRHAQFVPEYEAKARAILSAIIGETGK